MVAFTEQINLVDEMLPTKNTEKKFGDLVLSSFENMNAEQENRFKELVERSNGTVQIWIHSHYDEETDSSIAAEDYKIQRDKALATTNTNAMPIISFIETPLGDEVNIDTYGETYSKLMKGHIYYVPTFQDTSVPYILNKQDMLVTQHATEVENWDYIGGKLATLGVTKVIIRGRNFEYVDVPKERFTLAQDIYAEKNEIDGDILSLPDKCAGSAVVQLEARGFNILKTKVTYPEQIK